MDRLGIYQLILQNLEETFKAKDNDYGNSVGYTYEKYGDVSFLVRITDKFNRIESLTDPKHNITVKDEKLEDTILDMANYCLLWLVEREQSKTIKANKITSNTLYVSDDIICKGKTEPISPYSGTMPPPVPARPKAKYKTRPTPDTDTDCSF